MVDPVIVTVLRQLAEFTHILSHQPVYQSRVGARYSSGARLAASFLPLPPLPPPLHVPRKISHCGRGALNPWHKSCFLLFQTFTHTYTVRHTSKYGTSFSEWPRAPLSRCQGHLSHSSVANISYAAAVNRVLAVSLTSQCDQWGETSRARFPKLALYAECSWTPISQGLACLHKARI